MSNLNITFPFKQYKTLIEKYNETDWREITFQNNVIIPFIKSIVNNDIDVVDVSTQYKNKESKIQTRKGYAGEYTPDILLARNWNYNNVNQKNQEYIAVIEVKTPADNLDTKHTREEIEDYCLRNNVILTNCYNWRFYKKEEPNNPEVIKLNTPEQWEQLCNKIRELTEKSVNIQ